MRMDVAPFIAIILIILLLATLFSWGVGIVKAFQSHVATGICSIVLPPVGVIIG